MPEQPANRARAALRCDRPSFNFGEQRLHPGVREVQSRNNSGKDATESHSVGRTLRIQGLGHRPKRRLRRRVATLSPRSHLGRHGTDIDDGTSSPRHHCRKQHAGQLQRREVVHLHELVVIDELVIEERLVDTESCVVHQRRHRPVRRENLVRRLACSSGFDEVDADRGARRQWREFRRQGAQEAFPACNRMVPHPRPASSRATAAPIPDDAPVTTANRPVAAASRGGQRSMMSSTTRFCGTRGYPVRSSGPSGEWSGSASDTRQDHSHE